MALIDKLSAIGNAIREKTGKTDPLTLDQMTAEIAAIETETVDAVLIEKTVSDNGTYYAADDGADGYSSITVEVPTSGEIQTEYRTIRRDADTVYDFEFDGVRYKKLENAYVPDELTVQSILDLGITYHTKSTMNDGYETNGTIGEDDIEIDVTEFGTSVMIFAMSLMIVRFTGTPSEEEIPPVEENVWYMTDFFGSLFEYAEFNIPFVVSGECTKEHIIVVDELPEVGVAGAYYGVRKFTDVAMVMDGQCELFLGVPDTGMLYTATSDTFRDLSIPEGVDAVIVYVTDIQEIYMRTILSDEWFSFSEFVGSVLETEFPCLGAITNLDDADMTKTGYYIYLGVQLYQYANGKYMALYTNGELVYGSNGDGTCSVRGIGSYPNENIVIPSISPSGDTVTEIAYGAFQNSLIRSVTIPDTIETIDNLAFEHCVALTSVTFPDRNIENGYNNSRVFSKCYSLESVTLGEGQQEVFFIMFQDCVSLTEVHLPSSLVRIGNSAFWRCSNLTTITFGGTMEQWQSVTKMSDWNHGVPATKVICSDGEVPIKFAAYLRVYQQGSSSGGSITFEKPMTWEDWVNSNYNTNSTYEVYQKGVWNKTEEAFVLTSSGAKVFPFDEIIVGNQYHVYSTTGNAPLGPVQFTIVDEIHYADVGMTWGEWLDSQYHEADHFPILEGHVGPTLWNPEYGRMSYNGKDVVETDEIVAGATYTYYMP